MLDHIIEYFLTAPGRLVSLGRALFRAGSAIVFIGLVTQVATGGQSAVASIGGHAVTARSLAEIYPTLWTWWVPESVIGAVPALALAALGLWLALLGHKVERLLC